MSRFINRKSIVGVVIALTLVAAFAGGIALRGSGTQPMHQGRTKS
jgi:hypothetical protein